MKYPGDVMRSHMRISVSLLAMIVAFGWSAITAEVSGTLPSVSLKDAVVSYERDLIIDALKTTRGNRARAARLLQTTERIIGYKVARYAIDARRFRG